jgi:hypothetical protein
MTALNAAQYIERLRFFDGERLAAEDLQGIDDFNRSMRQLHNVSLHKPGIANGYAVTGAKGDRQVTIGPGYAIDAQGQEIVLSAPLTLPVPPVAGPTSYYLTLSYPTNAALQQTIAETRVGVCVPAGVVRLREEPLFCWVALAQTTTGYAATSPALALDLATNMKLVVCRVDILNCQINAIDVSQRINARPTPLVHISSGRQPLTSWEADKQANELLGGKNFVAAQTQVDTSCGRFRTTPQYIARLARRSIPNATSSGTAGAGPGDANTEQEASNEKLLDLLFHVSQTWIEKEKIDSFTLKIALPIWLFQTTANARGATDSKEGSPPAPISIEEISQQSNGAWNVLWVGIEG